MPKITPFPPIVYTFENGAIVPFHFVGHPPDTVGFNHPEDYGVYMTPRKAAILRRVNLFSPSAEKGLVDFFIDLEDLIIKVEKHLVLTAESDRNYFHLNLKDLREKYQS